MDKVEIESKHAPPLAECAHCEHMLPPGLGEIECEICGAVCKVSHQPTTEALIEEKVPCPHCNTILVAGTDERPIELTCGACSGGFITTEKVVKVEIECPHVTEHFVSGQNQERDNSLAQPVRLDSTSLSDLTGNFLKPIEIAAYG